MYELVVSEGKEIKVTRFCTKPRAVVAYREKAWELSAWGTGEWEVYLNELDDDKDVEVLLFDSKDTRRAHRAAVQNSLVL